VTCKPCAGLPQEYVDSCCVANPPAGGFAE